MLKIYVFRISGKWASGIITALAETDEKAFEYATNYYNSSQVALNDFYAPVFDKAYYDVYPITEGISFSELWIEG